LTKTTLNVFLVFHHENFASVIKKGFNNHLF